jgi:hypothetical protein
VGEQNSILFGCPGEHVRIVCSREANILDTNNIEIGELAQQTAQDIVVEVLVGNKAQHYAASSDDF